MRKQLLMISAAILGLAGTAVAAQTAVSIIDKPVTRAEAESKAKEHFAKIDVNKDGKLDTADREARKAEHFKKLDSDGNGAISQSEFAAAHQRKGEMKGTDTGRGGKAERRGMKHHGGGKRGGAMMLSMADTNKDSAISQSEFVAAHLKHFDMADGNKDGSVSADERKAARLKMREHMKQMGGMGRGKQTPPPAQ